MVGKALTAVRPLFALPDRWAALSMALAAILLLPVAAVAWIALTPSENIWPHLVAHALPVYLKNTLILLVAVGAGAAVIGTLTAWSVAMYEFPGRRVLEWALLAPLAVPAYLGAYALVDLFEYAGPVQGALREAFGWRDARDYWFPEIRSMGSAIVVLTLSLYPYVYLLARAAFREQSAGTLEVGRALGCGPAGVFARVGLPMARPAIAAGVALVGMETLNDFGAVDYFAVQTLTRGVFSIWLDTYNAGGAAQIAMVMLGFVLALLILERLSRRGQRYHASARRQPPVRRRPVAGRAGWALTGACALPVLAGFVLPTSTIAWHALGEFDRWLDPAFWRAAMHTFALASAAAVVACLVGIAVTYGARQTTHPWGRAVAQMTALGYAVPGAVLAVGLLMPTAALDHWVADGIEGLTGIDPGLLLTGSAAVIVFAYVVRFAAIAHGAIDGAFGRVTPAMEYAARTLGSTRRGVLRRVHLPLMQGSIVTAAMLIFVDGTKELPATLMLRPFNFETLSTTVYAAASLEDIARAGPAALAIVLVGLLPVAILARAMDRSPGAGGAPPR